MWFTYILRCSDSSYYVGHTGDISQRVAVHNAGRGSGYTAARVPVTLVWYEQHQTETQAIQREHQIKKWSKAKKTALIAGNFNELNELAKRQRQYISCLRQAAFIGCGKSVVVLELNKKPAYQLWAICRFFKRERFEIFLLVEFFTLSQFSNDLSKILT